MPTSIVAAIVVLGVLILVHELGHFLVAKRVGVRVLRFSIGFGPKLFGWKSGDTEYQLSAVPLGGYVKMEGEDSDAELDEDGTCLLLLRRVEACLHEKTLASPSYLLGVGSLPGQELERLDEERLAGAGGEHADAIAAREHGVDDHALKHGHDLVTRKLVEGMIELGLLQGKPEERILSFLMLRSLRQARYSEENEGHFALASPAYTHFTSPIRRYPDLIVHRILKALLAQAGSSARAPFASGQSTI